jgi:hypothetical protein
MAINIIPTPRKISSHYHFCNPCPPDISFSNNTTISPIIKKQNPHKKPETGE